MHTRLTASRGFYDLYIMMMLTVVINAALLLMLYGNSNDDIDVIKQDVKNEIRLAIVTFFV